MLNIRLLANRLLLVAVIGYSSAGVSASVSTLTSGQGGLDGLSVGADGSVYVSQPNFNRVLRIVDGQAETFMSGLEFPLGSAFDAEGNFYVSSSARIVRRSPDGQQSDYARGFSLSAGLAFDDSGNLYAADYNLSRISRIAADGTVTVFSQGEELNGPAGVAIDSQGRVYAGNFNDGKILRMDSSGAQTLLARPDAQVGYIAISGDTLYATRFDGNSVVAVNLAGEVTDLAGTGVAGSQDGDAASATFQGTNGITVAPGGLTVYVSEFMAGGGVRAIALEPALGFQINQGISGGWFYPPTSGSGLLLDVDPVSQFLFAAWFTYASDAEGADGSSRWFTASGNYQDNVAETTISQSSGGRFDDETAVNTVPVGSMRLEFNDCKTATVSYSFDAGASGEFPINRLIPGTELLCEALVPDPAGN